MNAFQEYPRSRVARVVERSMSARGIGGQAGISLIEVVVALLIMMIVLLGVFTVINYSITYNAANKSRSQALAILQQEVESVRSAKFNASNPPDEILEGGVKSERLVDAENGRSFAVNMTVDNDPSVTGAQDETYQCLSPQGSPIDCTLKEIAIEVKLAAPSPGWQAAVPARVVMRRVRGN